MAISRCQNLRVGVSIVYWMYMPTTGEKQSKLVHMKLDQALLERLDDFRFKHRLQSRTEAARCLMRLALDQKLTPKDEGSNSHA